MKDQDGQNDEPQHEPWDKEETLPRAQTVHCKTEIDVGIVIGHVLKVGGIVSQRCISKFNIEVGI